MTEETPPTIPAGAPWQAVYQPGQPQPTIAAAPVYPQPQLQPQPPNPPLLTQATQPAQQPGPPAQSPMQPVPYGAQPNGYPYMQPNAPQITPPPGSYVAYPGVQAAKAPPYPFGGAAVGVAPTPMPAAPTTTQQTGGLLDVGIWLRGIGLGIVLSLLLIANTLLAPALIRFGSVVVQFDALALDFAFLILCFIIGLLTAMRTGRVVSGTVVGLIGRGIASIVQFALYIITFGSFAQRTGLAAPSLLGYLLVALLYIPLRTAYDAGAATLGALVATRFASRQRS